MTRSGWIWAAAAALLATAVAFLNRFERVTLDFGIVSVYGIPLAVVVLAAFLLGMAAMFLVSLPQDRRTRDLLRARGLSAGEAPRVTAGGIVARPPLDEPAPPVRPTSEL